VGIGAGRVEGRVERRISEWESTKRKRQRVSERFLGGQPERAKVVAGLSMVTVQYSFTSDHEFHHYWQH
jgi:hypothetical protein